MNTETLIIIPVSGELADELGAFNLYACATELGLPILPAEPSRSHAGKLYWPGKDANGADRTERRADLRRMRDSVTTSEAGRAFIVEALRATRTTHAVSELASAATELAELMTDALGVHIYSLEDGDLIPANDRHVASINRMRAALGLPAAAIDTAPVWGYSATFADKNGNPGSYSTEVVCEEQAQAHARGRVELDVCYPGASKVDASVWQVAR